MNTIRRKLVVEYFTNFFSIMKYLSVYFLILLLILPIQVEAAGNRDWKWPVPVSNSLSSCYLDGRAHYALDISAAKNSAIYASYPGTVIYTYKNCPNNYAKSSDCTCGGCGQLGNSVYIRHTYNGESYVSRYGHMTSVNVSVGNVVDKNTIIGTVGSTGRSGGNHLDFMIYRGSSTSYLKSRDCVDPLKEQFLEMPNGLNANAATTSCCYTYVDEVKAIYVNPIDSEAPKISNVQVTDVSSSGYTVTCTVTDNIGVISVKFPTWPYPDGSWNPVWHEGTISGNIATCRINVSDHGNIVNTNYATHIYAYDAAGNSSSSGTDWIYIDGTAPNVSNIVLKTDADGYTITCKVTDSSGIKKVQFPTWTALNNQDDLDGSWQSSSKSAGTINGEIVSFRVNITDHNNEKGIYYTHLYAYDNYNNCTKIELEAYLTTNGEYGYEPVMEKAYNGHKYILFEAGGKNWTEAASYCQSIGGYLVCITSQAENDVVTSMVAQYGKTCWIGGNDLETEGTFVWESGEEFSYTNWAVGEPNNMSGTQEYMTMYGAAGQWQGNAYSAGHWDDTANDVYYAFVCEIPHTHSYTSAITKQATCTEDGTEVYTCQCGYTYTEKINKLGHDYTAELVDATCKDYASTVYTCIRCNDSYKEVHDAEYSDWSETYPEGIDESLIESRTEYRYQTKETKTSYSTSLSGWTQSDGTWETSGSGTISYVASWPSGFSTSHSLYSTYNKTPKSASETSTAKTVINSTGTEGYLYYHWCRNTYTGGPINRTTSPTNSGEFNCFHAFYSTTNPNTLTASSDGDGSRIFSNGDCCKDTYWYYNVAVNKQSYTTYKKLFSYYRWTDWTDWSTTKATESSTKKVETRTVYRYATPILGDHTYEEWVVVKEATDLVEGLKERTCVNCGNKEQQVIPKLDHKHSYSALITKTATCIEEGEKTHTCICEDSYTETIPALGHVMGNWKMEKSATCMEDGLKVKICSRSGCDYNETEVIKATGHAYGGWKVVKEATGTEQGLMERVCANCGEKEQKTFNNETHVHYYILNNIIEATCEKEGAKIYTCTDADDSYSETIPALGHVLGQWSVKTEATCDIDGLKVKTCYRDNCDYMEAEIIEATGHVYGEWITLEESTINEEGVKVRVCESCGNSEYESIDKLDEQPPALKNPFKDVKENAYYYNAVLWAVDKKITSGLSADIFAPNLGCTRAEVVTFLWRSYGRPEPVLEVSTFTDVPQDAYYSKAVRWATENGITSGYNDKEFGSDDQVTRCQFVTFLWRMEGRPEPFNKDNAFSDISTNAYYYNAVLWAVENGITAGYYQDLFAPDMSCTRCQVVSFLYRAYK